MYQYIKVVIKVYLYSKVLTGGSFPSIKVEIWKIVKVKIQKSGKVERWKIGNL